VLACELVAAVQALRLADTPPRGKLLASVFADVTAALPDIRVDHQLGDEIRIACRIVDRLADA
jgi:histidine ammonia-lyase